MSFTCSFTDVSAKVAMVADGPSVVVAPNLHPQSFSFKVYCRTMLFLAGTSSPPCIVFWSFLFPLGEDEGSAKLVPNPGPIVEDVCQADPKQRILIWRKNPHTLHTFYLLPDPGQEDILLLLRLNLDKVSSDPLAFSLRLVPRPVRASNQVAA